MDKKLDNRLRRLQGQLDKLHKSIAADTDCAEVIPQFLAVRGALAGAFEVYVKESMASCAKTDTAKLQTLITLLTRS